MQRSYIKNIVILISKTASVYVYSGETRFKCNA
nr:MAG TPA: hypothetical protein [Caudoviricetes sp.]